MLGRKNGLSLRANGSRCFHIACTSPMAYTTLLRCALVAAALSAGNAFASPTTAAPRAKTNTSVDQAYRESLTYFFDRPATSMMESLPLGNGRLGMLSDGGVQHQRITLNESSMWSGSVDSTAWNAEAYKQLPAIRKLLLAGRAKEAEDLIYRTFVCGGVGSGRGQGANTPLWQLPSRRLPSPQLGQGSRAQRLLPWAEPQRRRQQGEPRRRRASLSHEASVQRPRP